MTFKTLEVRDSGTYIGVLAIRMEAENDVQRYYLRREGFTEGAGIVVMRLMDQNATSDAYEWPAIAHGTRTMQVAHEYIERCFDGLQDGDVVDVQFILGETRDPKTSERLTHPL